MKIDYEQIYHTLEDDHWWFRGRRDIILRLLANVPKDAHIVEIGCSGGPLLAALRERGFRDVWGLDISEKAIAACRARGLQNVKTANGAMTGLESGFFDIVIASDVLEHIEDEKGAIEEWKRILKPGGKLVLFVPAHMFLWSSHDEANEHKRRYTRRTLEGLITNRGFSLKRSSYWNFFLFFPIACIRLLIRFLPRFGDKKEYQLRLSNSAINKALWYILKMENTYIASGYRFPVGVSVMVTGQK